MRTSHRVLLGGLIWGTSLFCQSLPVGSVPAIVIAPDATHTLYAATDGGVYKSADGGIKWTSGGLASVKDIVFDPASPSTLYAASFGVSKSRDGGRTWTKPIPFTCAWSIAASRSAIYAGTCGKGVSKSVDGGQSWTEVNSGIPATSVVWCLLVDPAD